MRQQEFENTYKQLWQEFAVLCEQLENRKPLMNDVDFSADYRIICHNLSIARERGFSPGLVHKLEQLAARGHQLLYTNRQSLLRRVLKFIAFGFPRLLRKNSRLFWLTSSICYLPALVVFLMIIAAPDLAYSFLGADTASNLEISFNQDNDRITTNRDIDSDFQMFGHYLMNNIGVDLRTFAGGILAGIGSFFILLLNSVMLGSASAHMLNLGYQDTFFTFIIAHGAPELTGMVISAMAGFKIGWGLIAPGNYSRKDALLIRSKEGIRLLFGAIFLTALAAPVEAFWSSIGTISPIIKYSVGGVSWLLVFAYLYFCGREKPITSLAQETQNGFE